MSPIFVRPVREQLEHDRLIRFLQAKYKRKFDVAINVGDEQVAPYKVGTATFFPDLVLTDGKRIAGVVEVESAESVNNLEAMAEWVHFSKTRNVAFHLYVPVQVFDAARRIGDAHKVSVAELWTYRTTVDGFDLVRMTHDPSASPAPSSKPAAASSKAAAASSKPAAPASSKPAAPAPPPAAAAKPAAKKPVAKPVKPAKKAPAKIAARRVTKKPAKASRGKR